MTAQTKKRCRMEEESIPSITSSGDKLPEIPFVKDTSQSRSLPSYTHTQERLKLARCDTLPLNQTALEADADDEASQDD